MIILSLRAFRRARDGAAKGRGSWERIRWPDAKFEVTSAKCDLGNEQQPEKREESREQREERWAPLEQRCAGDIGLLFLFYFASAVGSRDGSRNPRMGATCALRHDRPPAQSFARSLTYSLAREMREEKGSRPRKTTRTRRRERGEERRETSEERNWERIRWPDAKFEVAGAKNDLRNEQQREKREESREKKEERREGIEASQDHDDKEKREERGEKTEERIRNTDPQRPPEVRK